MTRPGVLLALAVLFAGCISDNTASETTRATPTIAVTTSTSITVTVAPETTSAGEGVVAVFDGASCTLEGQKRASPTESLAVTFTNESDETVGLNVTTYEGEMLEQVLSLIGGDIEGGQLDARPTSTAVEFQNDPGETITRNVMLTPGTWIVDCYTLEPGVDGAAHLWFAGTVESE